MAIGFQILTENLQNIGFYNFFLPFLLILAVVYGVLKATKWVSEDNTVISVVSFVVAFLSLGGIYLVVPQDFFTQFFGGFAVVIVVLLAIIILAGLLGIKLEDFTKDLPKGGKYGLFVIFFLLFLGIALFYLFQVNIWEEFINLFYIEDFVQGLFTVLMLAVLVLAIWFISKGGNGK